MQGTQETNENVHGQRPKRRSLAKLRNIFSNYKKQQLKEQRKHSLLRLILPKHYKQREQKLQTERQKQQKQQKAQHQPQPQQQESVVCTADSSPLHKSPRVLFNTCHFICSPVYEDEFWDEEEGEIQLQTAIATSIVDYNNHVVCAYANAKYSPPTTRMIMELQKNAYECTVCFDVISRNAEIWWCAHCYKLFHLPCVNKWFKESAKELWESWHCPCCQGVLYCAPESRCFCEKEVSPHANARFIPHSCGKICGKKLIGSFRTCNLSCHPGPCI